jgi:hypothetical protein
MKLDQWRRTTVSKRSGLLVFRLRTAALLGAALAISPAPALAGATTQPLKTPVWLCKPGLAANPCNQDEHGNAVREAGTATFPSGTTVPLNATLMQGSVAMGTEPFLAQRPAPVDCFYVYPTVDIIFPNPLLTIGSLPPKPTNVAMKQLLYSASALLGQCRMFAPMYRQATLLHAARSFVDPSFDPYTGPGFADVQQAWQHYWDHDNIDPSTGKRRGVVLLGHSQGSAALSAMLQRYFDGKAETTAQLISALVIGGRVIVPIGQSKGGGVDPESTFQHLPLCQGAAGKPVPTGCVIAYSAFKMGPGVVPPNGSMGTHTVPGHQVACVNPAGLLAGVDNGASAPLDAYFPTTTLTGGPVATPGLKYTKYPTGFVHHPSLLTGRCIEASSTNPDRYTAWLQIEGGDDVLPISAANDAVGLHLIDYGVALGTLQTLVKAQTAAWLSGR